MKMDVVTHVKSKQLRLWKKLQTESKFYPWSWNCRPSRVPASRKTFDKKIKQIDNLFLLI